MVRGLVAVLLCWRICICAAEPTAAQVMAGRTYMFLLRRALGPHWDPRPILRAFHGSDLGPWSAKLRITVAADGTLREVVVVSSSGLSPFDDAAVQAFQAIESFPVPATELLDPASSTLTFPFFMNDLGWPPPRYLGDAMVRAPNAGPSWQVGGSFETQVRDRAMSGRDTLIEHGSYDRMIVNAEASRSFRKVGLLELQVPFGTIRYRDTTGATTNVSGFGDVSVRLHAARHYGAWYFTDFLGLELPTGETAAVPVVGQILPTVVQLGSGTFNPEYGACLHRGQTDSTSLGLCGHFRPVFYAASNGYREPTVLDGRLFASTTLLCRHLSIQAGVFYERRFIARVNSRPVDGHQELFAEASAWFVLYRGWTMRTTIEVPFFETVDGDQLADTVRAMASLSYDFNRL